MVEYDPAPPEATRSTTPQRVAVSGWVVAGLTIW
jgi:hypothetical protein